MCFPSVRKAEKKGKDRTDGRRMEKGRREEGEKRLTKPSFPVTKLILFHSFHRLISETLNRLARGRQRIFREAFRTQECNDGREKRKDRREGEKKHHQSPSTLLPLSLPSPEEEKTDETISWGGEG